jgi:HTH-type transcriptional regulator/antitoxin HigA
MKTPTTTLNARRYAKLLAEALPKVIETDEENEAALARVDELLFSGRTASAEERALANLLVVLIEAFEKEHYPIGESTPLSMVKVLMNEHRLRQADLVDVFGSRTTASEVLRGKRRISRAVAERLGKRFGLAASAFLTE